MEIITCASDGRAGDLELLLCSIRHYLPSVRILIIPFSDDVAKVTNLAASHAAEMVNADPFWDELGKAIFKDEFYRPGVPRWTYFRKLNMFNSPTTNRLYLDGNCLLLSAAPVGKIVLGRDADVLFHSVAAQRRNFPWQIAHYFERLAPDFRDGYNLGFCAFTPQAAKMVRQFAELAGPRHRAVLSYAPEQSFLNYTLAHLDVKTRLMHHVEPRIAGGNSSAHEIERKGSGDWMYTNGPHKGRIIKAIKRTGRPNTPTKAYDIAAATLA